MTSIYQNQPRYDETGRLIGDAADLPGWEAQAAAQAATPGIAPNARQDTTGMTLIDLPKYEPAIYTPEGGPGRQMAYTQAYIPNDFRSITIDQNWLPDGVPRNLAMAAAWNNLVKNSGLKQGDPGTTTVYVDFNSDPPRVYLDPNTRVGGGSNAFGIKHDFTVGQIYPAVTVMDPVKAGFKQPTEGWERFWNQIFSGSIQEEYVPDWYQQALGKDETNFDAGMGFNPFAKNWGFDKAYLQEFEDGSFLSQLKEFVGTVGPFVAPMLGPLAGSAFGLANAAINKDPFAAIGALAGLGGATGILSNPTAQTIRGLSSAAGGIANKNPVSALSGLATAAGGQGLLAPDTVSTINTVGKIASPLYSALTYDSPQPQQTQQPQPLEIRQPTPAPAPTSPTDTTTQPTINTPAKTPYVPGLLSYVLSPPQPHYQTIPTFR